VRRSVSGEAPFSSASLAVLKKLMFIKIYQAARSREPRASAGTLGAGNRERITIRIKPAARQSRQKTLR